MCKICYIQKEEMIIQNVDIKIENDWNRKCSNLDINNMEDLLENMSIKNESKWNDMICKDIENIIGDFLFEDKKEIIYSSSFCYYNTRNYKEVEKIYFKNGKLKSVVVDRIDRFINERGWEFGKRYEYTLRKNGKYVKKGEKMGNSDWTIYLGYYKGLWNDLKCYGRKKD